MTEPTDRLAAGLADRYRIERELGRGGMATVYLAHDLKHDRNVAIKVLHADLAETLGRERFLREIRLAARLNHPHILPLYDSGEAGGHLYFVMPVMQGQTLRERLEHEKQLTVEDAVRIGTEVADALDYAHRNDIIHRDVKPENILLHESHALVADFGIGKALVAASEEASTTFTQVGVTIGTPAYMSPEQASGESIDGRSDLFALGCVLYEMLTGEVAFTGSTAQAVIAKRFFYSPPTVTDVRPVVPAAVSGTVAKLLEKERDSRHTSGAQVVMALRNLDAPAPARAATERSLVVLPFTNMSADQENEFFADGLTEELIADLAKVQALRVISRTSSMQLKGTTQNIRALGRELGVRYALTGSVRKAGNSLRITAQLIDTHRDEQRWADKYTGTVDDVFDLQERVSRAIADALNVTLSAAESSRLSDRAIGNVRAFELYVQARTEMRRYNLAVVDPLIRQAVDIEGNVPALRALRAFAKVYQVRVGLAKDSTPLDEAEAEANILLSLAPAASYGEALLGFVNYERGLFPESVRHFKAARAIDPNDAEIHFYLGIAYIAAGQNDAAAKVVRDIVVSDPLSSMAPLLAGIASWFVGRPAEGIESLERSVTLDPDSVIHRWTLGYHYALLRRLDDARAAAEWLHQRVPHIPYTAQLRSLIAGIEGRPDDARALLAGVNVAGLDAHTRFHLGESFAMAGDIHRGLELVQYAVENGFYPYEFIARHCPFLAPIRGLPEFGTIASLAEKRTREFPE